MGEATADGRLYNCSPRLACLPGVGCRMRESTAEERLYKLFARRGMTCTTALRSSAVDVRALVSRGRQANPVLTY